MLSIDLYNRLKALGLPSLISRRTDIVILAEKDALIGVIIRLCLFRKPQCFTHVLRVTTTVQNVRVRTIDLDTMTVRATLQTQKTVAYLE